MTLERRKKLCVEYIKLAKELRGPGGLDPWGRRQWSRRSAAALVLVPYANTELRPYARIVAAIRRRWVIEDLRYIREGPDVRRRYRAGLMNDTELRWYLQDCDWRCYRARQSRARGDTEDPT